jgi:hypothetical protein
MSFHEHLMADLRERAAEAGLSAVAILIDPAPGTFSGFGRRYGTGGWPVYDSVPTRIALMRHHGADAVVCVRFRKGDFDATAAEFLDVIRLSVDLEELWLGATQLLGAGEQGDRAAVADYADRNDIRLRILPRAPLVAYDIRWLLGSGRVRDAVDVVGRPPTWRRPRSGLLRLSWRPGLYRAKALDRPDGACNETELELTLETKSKGTPTLEWPQRDIGYLAFTAGPADLAVKTTAG